MTSRVAELSEAQKKEISDLFGEYVNLDKRERHYYNHDMGALPPLVKKVIGDTNPAAVVKIRTEEDAVKLLKFANKHKIPVVPRAGASSGYGGVIPTKGGIVADVTPLNNIISIDTEGQKAVVQSGIIWEKLERKLKEKELSLQAIPSSAPSSTVGGWLSQSGAGYGSYEFGWGHESMEKARVVLPTGEIREFSGPELKKLIGTMGTIGIITEITLKVQKFEERKAVSASFPSASALKKAIEDIKRKNIPLWSISFLNPEWADMKNKAPRKLHYEEVVDKDRPMLPVSYVSTFMYPASRDVSGLREAIEGAGGTILPEEIAKYETDEWFKSMKVKRLGPSFIPAEVLVPLEKMDIAFEEIGKKIKLPVLTEGMVISDGYVVLLCFMRHSERSVLFNTAFALSLSILKIAEENGGRAYSSGLFFASKRKSVFGERLAEIEALRKEIDPNGIMNPETLKGKGLLNTAVSMGSTFEPFGRIAGNMSGIGKVSFKDEKEIPAEVAELAYSCSQCGYCVSECDQYYGRGWESQSPRGKWFFIKEYLAGREKLDQRQTNTFLACTTCQMCDSRCELDMPIEHAWMTMRGKLVQEKKKMTFPPFEIMAASLLKERNIWANYRKDRDKWVPEDIRAKIKDKAEYAYFAGCTASFVENDVAIGAVRMLDDAGVEFTSLLDKEACCGIPMLVAGRWDVFEKIMRMNVSNMKKKGVKTVITSCPACWLMWHTVYPQWAKKLGIEYGLEAKHYSEVLVDHLDVLKPKFKQPLDKVVAWHDSCHLGRAGGEIYEPPRELLKAIPGIKFRELEYNREKAHCCGSVVSLIAEPPVAYKLGDMRLQEALDVKADIIAALCPCCIFQFRVAAKEGNLNIQAQDLGALVGRSLGYNIPDSTSYTLESWVPFEKMIDLMQPENMTNLMVELMPQMMAAMPAPLQAMMKMVKYVPGMDAMMKPMMPIMMPRLMPMVMPKVMPDMLKAVEKKVPMPDYMREQLPDLMPKAMDNLMPNMLPELIPLLTPRMIEYIKTH
ncbi:MAG: FAD-binding and (Fe-S)-binding domain-containing protein [Methanosarcina vacuolata]|jgi:Fe-S oxidoreductase/FAD/FMN-containing dehydrogenase|nr:FAD-binding and (Fe-S)-binding domain-containing protein [Methanosarcina vacuolata]